MRRKLFLFGVLSLLVFSATAQDPIFSQFYAAPLQVNPAFAGVTYAPRVTLNHRNQYPSWPNAYVTYAVSYEQSIENLNSAFGLTLMTDAQGEGVYKNNYFSAVYGYQVQINPDFYAKIGIELGLVQTTLDWDELIFRDQIDDTEDTVIPSEELRPQSLNATAFDASTGILFYGNNFYGGISLKHLNRYSDDLLRINENLYAGRPMRISLHAGTNINLSSRNNRSPHSFISPNALFVNQGDFSQVMAGAYLGYGRIFGGAWFRHAFGNADAAIFLIGVKEGILRVGYSYDATVSQLSNIPGGLGGTHEFSVTLNFDDSRALQRKRHRSRYLNCFGMFR